MIDIHKLKRVKQVLSALQGAGIPIPTKATPKYIKQKGNNFIYSNDGTTWFLDKDMSLLYSGNLEGFSSGLLEINPIPLEELVVNGLSTKPETTSSAESLIKNSTKPYWDTSSIPTVILDPSRKNEFSILSQDYRIPGDPNYAPNTLIENSSLALKKANIANTLNVAISNTILPKQIKNLQPTSLNIDPKSSLNLPTSIEVPNTITKLNDTRALESRSEIALQKTMELASKAKTNAAVGQIALYGTLLFTEIGDVFGQALAATDSLLTLNITAGYKGVLNLVSNFGPIGEAAGTIMGIASATGDIIQSLGGGTDLMTTTDKWMDSPLFSWNVGMLNGFAGKKSDTYAVDIDAIDDVGSSYIGSVSDLYAAQSKSGKKYGLFSSKSRKKANKQIAQAKETQNLIADIGEEAVDQRLNKASMGELAGLAYSLMINGGYDQKYTYAAKQGGLLEWNPIIELEWEPLVELNWELPAFKEGGNIDFVEELEWIPEFKSGGKTENENIPEIEETTLKNVIPEGALHKNKHHMEHAEGLTKKGIPVIDEDRNQLAEIEHSEIIFTLEVTKKLEEYYEIFYSDESSNKEKEQAALEAGKLLVYQILENTEDRVGLIESCKKGGSITLKKSTEDLIEESLEWIPNIIVVEEVIEEVIDEEKDNIPKKKSEKELMKEAIKEVLIELLTK